MKPDFSDSRRDPKSKFLSFINLGQLDVNLQTSLLGPSVVRVNVTYGLRDAGDFDDEYEGEIRFAVIAE